MGIPNISHKQKPTKKYSDSIIKINQFNQIIAGLKPDASPDEVEFEMVRGILQICQCEMISISVIDSQDGLIRKKTLYSNLNWGNQSIIKPTEGLLGLCITSGEALLENRVTANSQFNELADGVPGCSTRALLYFPMKLNQHVFGALQLLNKLSGDFNQSDVELLDVLVNIFQRIYHDALTVSHLRVENVNLDANRWELIRSRNTLRSLFDNIPDSLYIVDRNYRLIAINKSRAKRAGQEPPLLVGRLCYENLYKRSEPCPGCLVGETFSTHKTNYRKERQWVEGSEALEWEISTYPIVEETDQVVQVIIFEQDITEKNRLEVSLVQSEKLAAVGQLAAGIAHEINNPLTVIIANGQILQRELPENEDWQESVDLILRAGSRALFVVRNLLNFARKEKYEILATDVNKTIANALEMIKHEVMQRSIQLNFKPDDNLPTVLASADQLQGVWLNIIINAMDALDKEKGVITVSTGHQGNEIRVMITDNGQGIKPENMKKIFEPFYTTKGPGKGTGLGLSVCHRIIKQHGGDITVESQVGIGTSFTVTLPIY
jgi:signal transduction histidine kinase